MGKISELNTTIETVLVPYSIEIGSPKAFLEALTKGITKEHKFREVFVSTNNGKEFKEGMSAFYELVSRYID